MIETKEIEDLESYFEGIKTTLAAIENNFWNNNSVASSVIDITKEEWKHFKKDMLEITINDLEPLTRRD